MLIGELARRLRVTNRTLRHYESIGLLRPDRTDPGTGYRIYGADAVVRGLQIEQLKAAGLSLTEIGDVLARPGRLVTALEHRRSLIDDRIGRLVGQRAALDAILDGSTRSSAAETSLATPTVIDLPASHGFSECPRVALPDLAATIRRHVQRLRRRVRSMPGTWTFAARFPLDPGDIVDLEIAALTDDARHPSLWPAVGAIAVSWYGPHELLPLAYDAALAVAEQGARPLLGSVQETYHSLGRSPVTSVVLPLAG